MEKILESRKIKIVLIFIILISMLISYLPAIVQASDNSEEYVKFELKESANETVTGVKISIPYRFNLSGVQTGFKNVKLYVTGEDVDTNGNETPSATIIADKLYNTYNDSTIINNIGQKSAEIIYGNINSGRAFDGTINFVFNIKVNEQNGVLEDYTKKINFVFHAEYIDVTGNLQNVNIEETREINVNSREEKLFSAQLKTELAKKDSSTYTYKSMSAYNNFEVSKIRQTYYIDIKTLRETYSKTVLSISRTTPKESIQQSDINTEENLLIDATQFIAQGYEVNVIRNEDGVTNIEITRGKLMEEYDNTEVMSIDRKIPISVEYNIIENSAEERNIEPGSTNINCNITNYIEGFNEILDRTGSTYIKAIYRYSKGYNESYPIYSNPMGIGGFDYDLNFEGQSKDSTILLEEIEEGSISPISSTKVQLDVRGEQNIEDANKDENRLIITNYNNENYNVNNANISKLTYEDNGIEKTLTGINMQIKNINVNLCEGYVEKVSFYKKGDVVGVQEPFFVATQENTVYIPEEGEDITEYYAVIGDIVKGTGIYNENGIITNGYSTVVTWDTQWDIKMAGLIAKGLTEEQIKTIKSVTRYQGGKYKLIDDQNPVMSEIAITYIESLKDLEWSYMDFDIGEFNISETNTNMQMKKIKLSMYKNNVIFEDRESIVKNENPTFYVKLSNDFMYLPKSVTISTNAEIYISNKEIVEINGNKYLKIECKGTYDSSKIERVDITINILRKLINTNISPVQYMEAYMITDNENYPTARYYNTQELTHKYNGEIIKPDTIFAAKKQFTVYRSNIITSKSKIIKDSDEYLPDSTTEDNELSEKKLPLILADGELITYQGEIKSTTKKLNNVSLFYKLPVNNNKTLIHGNLLLENDYQFSSEYLEEYGTAVLDSYEEGGKVKHISRLNNLKNIRVYRKVQNNKVDVDCSISYSTSLDATIESDFIPHVEGEEFPADITAIKIDLTNGVDVNDSIYLEYEMEMPDEPGMVGAVFGVKYIIDGEESFNTLESEPVYVINGSELGTIEAQKVFEGYEVGQAPEGINLSGIEFKLQNEAGEMVKNGEGNDLVGITDAEGKAIFSNIVPGRYKIVETTQIPGYIRDNGIEEFELEQAKTVETQVINSPKRAEEIIIQKLWEDTNDQQGPVTLELKRTSGDGIDYCVQKQTDDQGIATFKGVMYGEYTITEIVGKDGWGKAEPKTITIDDSTLESGKLTTEITNPIGKADLEIQKTVPEGQSVEGLVFDISGIGIMNYKNTEGTMVTNNTKTTITVGQDYSAVPNVDVVIAEDKLSVTITISELPLGLYIIREKDQNINIGEEGGTENNISKYVEVIKSITLAEHGTKYTVGIKNVKKTGYLEIQKRAYLQADEEQQEIGDLSEFKVRIFGTSYYGTQIDKVTNLDENGYAKLALEIGKYTVKELPVDGYDVYYKDEQGNLINSETGIEVKIGYNETTKNPAITKQEITNVHTGVGYVKVVKTLEGVANPAVVVDAGIKFKVVGKNIAGGRVEEVIEINQIDIENDIAYGISNAIPVGGDYQLEEIEATIPDYFEGIEPVEVNLTTANALLSPLVINVENKRAEGNLEIITKTVPEGGPLTGITYKVTEVKVHQDGSYDIIDENSAIEIQGDNGGINPSYAKMTQIYAGNYLVEQVTIPDGYEKDVSQIIEVPNYGTGYAVFEISKKVEKINTKVIINKQILNGNGEIATTEDFENAELLAKESFEVKITNVNTKQVYYTFINSEENATISGLLPGDYQIEEVYKPKYITEGYYKVIEGIVLNRIEKQNNVYIFNIADYDSSVELTVRNVIDTEFGFGGQDLKDNYSEVDVENQEIISVTKAITYIVDENGDAIPGATFRILDKDGNRVVLGTIGEEFTTVSNKLVINGLPIGTYTIVNTSVPDGYVKPEDKQITVFEDATRIARIEIQKNIPRGAVTLSTTYVNSDGETKYVPRSKYKVVDSNTGEVIRFTKTMTGDYIKSNLADATDEIALKSGSAEVTGIEIGNYEIGLVELRNGYGMQTDSPEIVEVKQGEKVNVNVEVNYKKIKQISGMYNNTVYLDESGKMWILGEGRYDLLLEYDSTNVTQIKFKDDTRIEKFDLNSDGILAVDTKGKVWLIGDGKGLTDAIILDKGPICITDIPNHPFNKLYEENIRITDIEYGMALDSNGRVWTWNTSEELICINEINGNPFKELSEQGFQGEGIKIKQISSALYMDNYACIDELGRVWTWGNNRRGQLGSGTTESSSIPICISDNTEIGQNKITKIVNTNVFMMALDEQGRVWTWGSNSYGQVGNGTTVDSLIPICISNNTEIGENKIIDISADGVACIALDNNGKVWTWGHNGYGEVGNGTTVDSLIPICISDITNLKDVNVQSVSANRYRMFAIDINECIWSWGIASSNKKEYGKSIFNSYYLLAPEKIVTSYNKNLEYNLKFKNIENDSDLSYAIDERGTLWGRGYWSGTDSYSEGETWKIVENLFNEKIISLDAKCYTSVVITESNKIYIWGGENYFGNDSSTVPMDITEKITIDGNAKLVKAEVLDDGRGIIVLDSLGRIWTFGAANENTSILDLGHTNTENLTIPTCISNDISESLYNIKIVDIASGSCGNVYAIDDVGRLWAWGERGVENIGLGLTERDSINMRGYPPLSTPMCISDISETYIGSIDTKFVNISAGGYDSVAILDSNGKVWYFDYQEQIKCLSDDKGSILYSNYLEYENYRIEIVKALEEESIYMKDNYGNSLIYNDGITQYINQIYNVPNEIIDFEGYDLYIDGMGQLWNGDKPENAIKQENPIYNIKAKKILAEGIVEMDNPKGEIYQISSDTITKVGYTDRYLTDYMGLELRNTYTSDNLFLNIALDENGKIWTWAKKAAYDSTRLGRNIYNKTTEEIITPTCLNDIFGTDLNNAYIEHSDFEIEKIYIYDTVVVALDNYGKIWTWTNDIPKCLCNEIGSDIYNKYESNPEFKIIEMLDTKERSYNGYVKNRFIAKDNNNDIWVWGNNKYGELGNGTSTTVVLPFCISDTISGGDIKKIYMYEYSGDAVTLILDTNGNMWSCGGNAPSFEAIGILGSSTNKNVPTIINSAMTGIENFEVLNNVYVVAYNENNIWTWGYNRNGELGLGYNSIYTRTLNGRLQYYYNQYIPTKILTDVSIDAIYGNYNGGVLLDKNGKVWTWGNGAGYSSEYTYKVPKCISENPDSLIYGKVIIELNGRTITDINGEMYEIGFSDIQKKENPVIIERETVLTGELTGKTVTDIKGYIAIDSQGNLYGWYGFDGFDGITPTEPFCITERASNESVKFRYNNKLLNMPIINNLNTVQIQELVNDQIVKDVNGNYWFFTENEESINLNSLIGNVQIQEIYNEKNFKDVNGTNWFITDAGNVINITDKITNKLYGKTIAKVIKNKYVITSENEIYYIGGAEPIYIMDSPSEIEIQDIYYNTDNIENIYNAYYIILDTSGKVWTCGSGKYGQLGNGDTRNISSPVCISNIEGTEFNLEYVKDENFKITKLYISKSRISDSNSIIALDSNGKIWSWGYNGVGQLGNGTTKYVTTPICITNIANTELNNAFINEDARIVEIQTLKEEQPGPTYRQGSTSICALDSNGKVWTWGYNANGQLATGDKENKNTPVCVSGLVNSELSSKGSEFKITKVALTGYVLLALGNDGKMYSAGSVCGMGNVLGTSTERLYLTCIDNNMINIQDFKLNYSTVINQITESFYKEYVIAYGENTMWSWGTPIFTQVTPTEISTQISGIINMENSNTNSIILDENGKVWVLGNNNKLLGYTASDNVLIPVCITDNNLLPIYNKNITEIITNKFKFVPSGAQYEVNISEDYLLAVDSDGVIYEWGMNINEMQECTKFDTITQIIYGDTITAHKLEIAKALLRTEQVTDEGLCYTTIYANEKTWVVMYSRQTYEILGIEEIEESAIYTEITADGGIQVSEVLDTTHIKTTDDRIYSIAENGILTEVIGFTPSNEPIQYQTVEIDGVTLVQNTNYKALDNNGNLYVWGKYTGGYTNGGETVENAICTTQNEYIVEPIYSVTNGWSVIKGQF